MEMAALFAIWNWSRRARSFAWTLLGIAILLSLAVPLVVTPNPLGGRIYAALLGMYLFSGLMWAWWLEGLKPSEWRLGEFLVALSAVGLFGLANSTIK